MVNTKLRTRIRFRAMTGVSELGDETDWLSARRIMTLGPEPCVLREIQNALSFFSRCYWRNRLLRLDSGRFVMDYDRPDVALFVMLVPEGRYTFTFSDVLSAFPQLAFRF